MLVTKKIADSYDCFSDFLKELLGANSNTLSLTYTNTLSLQRKHWLMTSLDVAVKHTQTIKFPKIPHV